MRVARGESRGITARTTLLFYPRPFANVRDAAKACARFFPAKTVSDRLAPTLRVPRESKVKGDVRFALRACGKFLRPRVPGKPRNARSPRRNEPAPAA